VLDRPRAFAENASFEARARTRAISTAGVVMALTAAGVMTTVLLLGAGTSHAGPESPPGRPPADALPSQAAGSPEVVPYVLLSEGTPITAQCGSTVELDYSPDGAPYNARSVIDQAARVFAAAAGVPVLVRTGVPTSSKLDHISIGWVATLGSVGPHEQILGIGQTEAIGGHLDGGRIQLSAARAWPANTHAGGEEGIILHELGHAAGNLGHDKTGQMRPDADPERPPGYSRVEQAALRLIFTSGCTPSN